ncbi:hypothetical protein J6590_013237, partial [Homalodisca vitripennis]
RRPFTNIGRGIKSCRNRRGAAVKLVRPRCPMIHRPSPDHDHISALDSVDQVSAGPNGVKIEIDRTALFVNFVQGW